jgi:hypothetical protein
MHADISFLLPVSPFWEPKHMENKIIACILDVAGVQSYIFSSNKLKENLGASFIIKNIYDHHLSEVIKNHFTLDTFDIDFWKPSSADDNVPPKKDEFTLFGHYAFFDVCYIGGGNAILFFKSLEDFSGVMKKFTARLLVKAPGVHLISAHIETTPEDIETNFKNQIQALRDQLTCNKNVILPNIFLPRHGFTASCPRTGLSAEVLEGHNDESMPLSSVSVTKLHQADKTSFQNEFNDLLHDIHNSLNISEEKRGLTFTDNIENLGQQQNGDDNFIAVVHIDGNQIGNFFTEQFKQNNRNSVRRLSIDLAYRTWCSFSDLIEIILKDENGCLLSKQNSAEKTLPVRPIIIGGDDITFVCPGKLGIYFAKTFMERFEAQTSRLESGPLTACAGIAIAKTKYPFFRAYKMAEALCDSAKKMRKKTGHNGSWLDFHIIEAAKTGDLDQVRENHFQTAQGRLFVKPYPLKIPARSPSKRISFSCLAKKARVLKQLPKNKRSDIAKALFGNAGEQTELIKHLTFREFTLPLPDNQQESFFQAAPDAGRKQQSKATYFLDLLELIEFYPDELLGKDLHQTTEAEKEHCHGPDT